MHIDGKILYLSISKPKQLLHKTTRIQVRVLRHLWVWWWWGGHHHRNLDVEFDLLYLRRLIALFGVVAFHDAHFIVEQRFSSLLPDH